MLSEIRRAMFEQQVEHVVTVLLRQRNLDHQFVIRRPVTPHLQAPAALSWMPAGTCPTMHSGVFSTRASSYECKQDSQLKPFETFVTEDLAPIKSYTSPHHMVCIERFKALACPHAAYGEPRSSLLLSAFYPASALA